MFFLLIKQKYSSIVVFDPYYSVLSKVSAICTRTPLVLFLRGVPWEVNLLKEHTKIRQYLRSVLDACGMFFSNRIVAASDAMKAEIGEKHPFLSNRITVCPNDIVYPPELRNGSKIEIGDERWKNWITSKAKRKKELAEEYDFPEKCILMSTSGELNNRKNVEHLVRAIGACRSDNIALIICGDGPEKKKIETVIVGLGLTGRVVLAGWLEDPYSVISGSDLFVMPSRYEGMANSMLEALGAGVGVIAADTPETREVLAEENLLFEPANVGTFAERLDKIALGKSELENIQNRSHERAKIYDFSWKDRVLEAIDGL